MPAKKGGFKSPGGVRKPPNNNAPIMPMGKPMGGPPMGGGMPMGAPPPVPMGGGAMAPPMKKPGMGFKRGGVAKKKSKKK